MQRIPIDTESSVVHEQFAVVYAPRRSRERFSEGAVVIMESEQAARAAARPDEKKFAARVVGPSRSSEGLRLYYLESWLD
ncbi:MAG: hypothetical protein OQK27_05415 [Gammaproteobacteria bacterium]|nr:hypothetical protein [Gammaproteobacteria bacterium]MCW9057976.1 hypothetical protein [Gammaproteobacteria bacterium]